MNIKSVVVPVLRREISWTRWRFIRCADNRTVGPGAILYEIYRKTRDWDFVNWWTTIYVKPNTRYVVLFFYKSKRCVIWTTTTAIIRVIPETLKALSPLGSYSPCVFYTTFVHNTLIYYTIVVHESWKKNRANKFLNKKKIIIINKNGNSHETETDYV